MLGEPAPTIIVENCKKIRSIEVICWAGRVYLFFQLLALIVGEPAPTIIVENQIKIMSIQVICWAGAGLLFLSVGGTDGW